MWVELTVIGAGSLVASFVNAAFATGGIYLLIAATSSVLPLTVAVPLQPMFAAGSLVGRILFFRRHIDWHIVGTFAVGAVLGVYAGSHVFVTLSEAQIAWLLGVTLLVLIWFPQVSWGARIRHPFVYVGVVHCFISTIFAVGALLQPLILRTRLKKLAITGTLAAALFSMDLFKIVGYSAFGFDYRDYGAHIAVAVVAGFAGTWIGRHVTHRVSEQTFRLVFRTLIALVALRLLYRGWVLA